MEKLAGPLRLMLIVSLLTWLSPASPATARDEDFRSNHTAHGTIRIHQATIKHGQVVVEGDHAKKQANIYWEDNPVPVTTSDRHGHFKFSTTDLPIDCVGKLSAGVSTIDVVIRGCTTQQGGGGGVLKTGQTTNYAAGDDGALQKGVAVPDPRFTDNVNGTIKDNLTGLIWLTNANCPNSARDWATALADVASLNSTGNMNSNSCGDTSNAGNHQTDWRLPNRNELSSLFDLGMSEPALPLDHHFTNFKADLVDSYWSSTTLAVNPDVAWFVSFYYGDMGFDDKTAPVYYVTAVRGGS